MVAEGRVRRARQALMTDGRGLKLRSVNETRRTRPHVTDASRALIRVARHPRVSCLSPDCSLARSTYPIILRT